MFLTDCPIILTIKITLLVVVLIKISLLIGVLFIGKFSLKNYLFSIIILVTYYLLSNINTIYSCNVNLNHLFNSLLYASLVYGILCLANKLC